MDDIVERYRKLAEEAKARGAMRIYRELRKKMLQEQYKVYKRPSER